MTASSDCEWAQENANQTHRDTQAQRERHTDAHTHTHTNTHSGHDAYEMKAPCHVQAKGKA